MRLLEEKLLLSKVISLPFSVSTFFFCPFHKLTGLYCPGCGITRMFLALFKGEFYQAFRYNPLVFFCLPIFLIFYLDFLYHKKKGTSPLLKKMPTWGWVLIIFIFLLYGVLRNIDGFYYLKPTKI